MHEQNGERREINKTELGKRPRGPFRALRKNQGKMQQQSRHQDLRHDLDPINLVVESVQLAAVMEHEENEGDQAENVKVHGARCVPPARKNEQSDEEIDQAYDARIIFNGCGFFGRRGDKWSLELLIIAREFVADLRPKPRAPEPLRYLDLPGDGGPINGQQMIADSHPSPCGG